MPKQCVSNASKSKSKSKSKNQSTESDLNALNEAERLTRSGSARKGRPRDEQGFLADVREAIALFSPKTAKVELVNWGGWWRNRYRENPAKAKLVLAEIHSMVKERRILENPGAAACDLWKRLP